MCTIVDNPKLKRPKKETFIAYKVFGYGKARCSSMPHDFMGDKQFKFGWNIWCPTLGLETHEQEGFQLFRYKKDAIRYAMGSDKICPVKVNSKDIVKMSDVFNFTKRGVDGLITVTVFEVTRFAIWKKDWFK